ncbi:MAG: polysaccharide deacetylase family protein [Acutalibacter sp.]|nr:polysaccharide deacetylase family protein [Acutalibacter sp.]
MGAKGKRGFFALWRLDLRALLGLMLLALGAAGAITITALAAQEGVEVPVIMYHSVLKDEAQHGAYVISPAEFEKDLLWLKENGYTTVSTGELIAYTQGGTLPEKPVLITFDDGYYNNYLYAYAIAKQYRCRFLLSPIGRYADSYTETGETNAYYTHATWEQLREMVDSGLVELGNHSYNLHNAKNAPGVKRKRGESDEAYRARITADLTKAQEAFQRELGEAPRVFVYPFGAMGDGVGEIVRELGFEVTFTCREKVSRITRDKESLYGLGRYLRPSGISSGEFFKKIGLQPLG